MTNEAKRPRTLVRFSVKFSAMILVCVFSTLAKANTSPIAAGTYDCETLQNNGSYTFKAHQKFALYYVNLTTQDNAVIESPYVFREWQSETSENGQVTKDASYVQQGFADLMFMEDGNILLQMGGAQYRTVANFRKDGTIVSLAGVCTKK